MRRWTVLTVGVLVLGCGVAATTSQGREGRQRPAQQERRARGPGEKPQGLEYVLNAAFSPDGKRLLTQFHVDRGRFEDSRSLALWDVQAAKCLWTIHKKQLDVRRFAFSPDGKQILVLGSGKLLALDLQGQVSRTLREDGSDIGCLAVTPDGKSLLLGRSKGAITVLTLPEGQVAHTLEVKAGAVGKLLLSPDGRFLISYYVTGAPDDDVMFRLWDLQKKEAIREFRSAQGYDTCSSCAFSPDGKRLAVGGHPGEDPPKGGLKLLELPSCKQVQALPVRSDAVAFTPDGNRLLCACGSHQGAPPAFFLWDLREGREVYHVTCPKPDTSAIVLSADGRLVFTAEGGVQLGDYLTLKLWDGASGKPLRVLYSGKRDAAGR
jgi:WD40 repeat protein